MRTRATPCRWWLPPLASAAFIGCAGGGSGGSPADTPVPAVIGTAVDDGPASASTLTTAPVEATDATLHSLLGALAFPLYAITAPSDVLGTRVGTPDGAITINHERAAGAWATSFPTAAVTNPDATSLGATRTGTDTRYMETWGDATTGWSLAHSRLGMFSFVDGGVGRSLLFYFGAETATADLPLSSHLGLGSARYDGRTVGLMTGGATGRFTGDIRLVVDFARDRLDGIVTGLMLEGPGGGQPLGTSFLIDTAGGPVGFTRDAGGAALDVPLAAMDDATGARTACCGTLVARFFGPAAREVAGGWRFDGAGRSLQAVFGASRDPSLSLEPVIVYATPVPVSFIMPTDTTYPLYAADGSIAGTRRLDPGGLDLRYLEDGAAQRVVFLPGEIAPLSQAASVASQSGFRWHEFGLADASAGQLAWSRYGRLSAAGGHEPVESSWHFGAQTPASGIPSGGRGHYIGRTAGALVRADGLESLSGLIDLTVDFSLARASGRLSALEATSADGRRRSLDGLAIHGSPGGSGPWPPYFEAELRGADDRPAGTLTGRLFGPSAQEVAGGWTAALGGGTASGAFGARTTDASHPAGPVALLPWEAASGTRFTLGQIGARTTATGPTQLPAMTSVEPGPSFLTPLPGGDLLLETSRSANFAFATFGREAFVDTVVPLEGLPAAMHIHRSAVADDQRLLIAGEGTLSHLRFGYWEDRPGTPGTTTAGFFHVGQETPPSRMPLQGSATYLGAAVGQFVTPSQKGTLHAALRLDADFGSGRVSGRLSSLVVRSLHPASTAGASPFANIELTGDLLPGTAAFSGAALARNAAQEDVASGTMAGRFHGREAQEVGGHWQVSSPASDVQVWGAFGGTR
jgi:hypothetical protein